MLRKLETSEPINMLDTLFAERRIRPDRPWVMLNMVTSVDGATAVGGGASALNDADDRALFLALRAVSDVVLMGAQTVRAENLGPIRMDDDMARHRLQAGFKGDPRMVILTRSLDLDRGHRVFADPKRQPFVLTGLDVDQAKLRDIQEVAEVRQIESLDGGGIVESLAEFGVILCEGGPTVNSQLFAAGVVDEVNLTLSPMVAMGESKRLASGVSLDPPLEMTLDRTLKGDGSLFLRYVRTERSDLF